jgi:hypothetical protein
MMIYASFFDIGMCSLSLVITIKSIGLSCIIPTFINDKSCYNSNALSPHYSSPNPYSSSWFSCYLTNSSNLVWRFWWFSSYFFVDSSSVR